MYHEGEIAVQARLEVSERAARVSEGIYEYVPEPASAFLEDQTFAAICIVEVGKPFIMPLTGSPGFISADSDTTIRFRDAFASSVPLPLRQGGAVGSIIMDFEGRRRMRANGNGSRDGDDLLLEVTEVYSNCPRFITPRRWSLADSSSPATILGHRLTDRQVDVISSADTFFIGTQHSTAGADASHRGGPPGFVSVIDARTLTWPDYAGNNMLNTLGNLEVEPRSALLFIDFDRGDVLQLFGDTRLEIDAEGRRTMHFNVDSIIETNRALTVHWSTVAESKRKPVGK